jgi:cytochrome P450
MDAQASHISLIPSITKSKFVFFDTLRILRNPVEYLAYLAKQGAPLVTLNLMGKKYHVLQHPEFIKHVLQENHRIYYKPGQKLFRLFLGEGLSTAIGPAWLKQRRTMAPAFHKQKLEMMTELINEETTRFVKKLESLPDHSTVNVTHEVLKLTMSVISRALFNDPLNGEISKMIHTLEDLASFGAAWMKSPVKIPTDWPTPANIRYRKNVKIFDSIIFGIINRRRSSQDRVEHHDLLDLLLNHYDDETGAPLSDKLLRDEVTTMFMAGHETTAQTLSWILYHLALQKDIQKTLKDEGQKLYGYGIPTFSNLSEMHYTKQVVNEALRHYPSIWAISRIPSVTDVINGYQINAGETVLLNIYGLHHHPAYWSHPDDFNPSHFNPDISERRPPHAFIPFGAGPRMCLGSHFAMMVMQIVISRVACAFEFDPTSNIKPEIEPNISLRVKGGIYLKIRKIESTTPASPPDRS